ncbi:MAG: peptidylprolyl isomerase [Deltaproteobacteria bacterium]|jgi:peptidyl-prolyl cis-trans isomerase A (cyclophilin A)|nr:peptidylprolyl isomerase [Deltaproteobacteria bacterium]MBW2534721.1 peptidylprolyl isomerase [Deltaproteobacteria bacterium]
MNCRPLALIAASTLGLAALAGCDKPPPEPTATTTAVAAQLQPTAAPEPKKEEPLPPPPKALLEPDKATEQAPPTFKAKFQTTKGDFVIQVTRAWAPIGADRFYNLVKLGFYDEVVFFRVVANFVVQFGIHGHPEVAAKWREAKLKDEPVKQGNKKGYVTYAKGGPDTRTTQVFINFKDNDKLDKMGFPAFGKVVEGMDVVESLYKEHGERPSRHQQKIQQEGNRWLKKMFPELDSIKKATIVE